MINLGFKILTKLTVRQSAQVAVDQSSANAEAIDSINLELDDKASTGELEQVKSDIKNVDDKVIAHYNFKNTFITINNLL